MLKFFTARDDENESLLGAITEDEGDSTSLQDTKHHWLNRPCLLVLKDGDVSKPALDCREIRPQSPSKATSDATLRSKCGPCEQKPIEHPTESASQVENGSCTVTSISTWGEKECPGPLVLGPADAAWAEEEEEKNQKSPVLPSKEDSVIEEKEREESGLEQQDDSCSLEGPSRGDQTNTNKAGAGREEEAMGECAASPVDLDNMSETSPVGILSKDRVTVLGEVAPVWVPDAEAQVCMKCGIKFTFTKRRHHCRACGKVFCALCSSLKFKLTHLDGKEGRVCISCHSALIKRMSPKGKRKVWFADEILTNKHSESAPTTPIRGPAFSPLMSRVLGGPVKSPVGSPQIRRTLRPHGTMIGEACGPYGWGTTALVSSSANLIPLDGLPPILTSTGVKGGKVVKHLSLSLFGSSFFGSQDHAGFLYVRSTLQSLQGLPLPNQPYLFGLLVHRAEVAWAKAFPLRLMLRLGAEYRFYPCPLYSVRFRKPLFGDIGHTIMRLLVDFRNYRYSLPMVSGLTVDLEAHRTCIKIPTTGYNELMKAVNKSNEHVLAIGACFNETADSHLICVQADDGQYQTQAISIHNQPCKVTGSCFIIFSSALKASAGYLAKSSIVEDGLMVQITVETMAELRRSLREMKDHTVTCGRLDQSESQELVCVQWIEEKCTVNKGIISPIDGKSMESISSTKMFQKSEYKENGKIIRWTEVFFLQTGDNPKGAVTDSAEHNRLTERIARAFCLALCPHLKLLKEDGMAKLGLRVTFDSQEAGFVAGSNGQPLPAQYLNALNSVLIPVIHSRGRKRDGEPIVMELIFYILENIT
ncbi:zinc finger FYVE domain-containing protein 9 isoform X2 [Pelmatolapia mariae]|uniref:zinc finger FYVE domain-containing protein 9 isoform X2 n=1 Tax=Pelmatolapia mariae TaxID=158779 RepID=UPI002FE62E47